MDATRPHVNLKRPKTEISGKSKNGRPLLTCRFANYSEPEALLGRSMDRCFSVEEAVAVQF